MRSEGKITSSNFWIYCRVDNESKLYLSRYEGQRDMLYNQTFNLDQVAFASEGIKDAQQTVCVTIIKHLLQMGSNKELKGLMKTVKIQDIDVSINIMNLFLLILCNYRPFNLVFMFRICKMK